MAYHRDPKYIGSSTELRDWYKKHGFEDLGGDAREGYDIRYYPAAQDLGAKYGLPEFTTGVVAVKEESRCVPNRGTVARYRQVQALHDQLSKDLRPVFSAQRKLA